MAQGEEEVGVMMMVVVGGCRDAMCLYITAGSGCNWMINRSSSSIRPLRAASPRAGTQKLREGRRRAGMVG